jgi:hypothetical protein
MSPITLRETVYSHPASGRKGTYYTLYSDNEPIQLDTYFNDSAKRYAYLFAAATDLLAALEKIVDECGVYCEGSEDIDTYAVDQARQAIRKAKGDHK